MSLNKVLKVNNSSELLSYIINITPELASEIDLPEQGKDLTKIGKIIMSNTRLKNAFINTINVIGLTIIDRNYWNDPWENFTNRGFLPYGQTVRELLVDIADVFDYNENASLTDGFLKNVVPNVYNYLHEVNYQKFYKTTTSDEQIAMAFTSELGLFDLIEYIIGSLWEGYKYDKYIVNKYMLCRRIVDGTVTAVQIKNYATMTPRQRVSAMKNISNKMTFRNPNYNPAGARIATSFDKQIAIVNTDFEADLSTEVLATSFFRNEAEMKTRMALIDGFGSHDTKRLTQVLGTKQYTPFTADELEALSKIPASIIDDEFFQNYNYSMDNSAEFKQTNFYNPETLKNNHWLHTWKVMSTSPYKQAVVFTTDEVAVTDVAVSPQEASISAGLDLQLYATVSTTGFANKAVTWSITQDPETEEDKKATVDINGKVHIPAGHISTTTDEEDTLVKVTATSVYDTEKTGTASITVL